MQPRRVTPRRDIWKSRASVAVGVLFIVNSVAAAAYSVTSGRAAAGSSPPPAAAALPAPAPAGGAPAGAAPAPSAHAASPHGARARASGSPATAPAPAAPLPFAGRNGLQVRPDVAALAHRTAAYAVPRADLARARSVGITTAMLDSSQLDAGYRAELRQAGMGYIDTGLWSLIASYVPTSCQGTDAPCVLPAARQAELLNRVKAYADGRAGDDQLVAFYALDDYPGNIADLLVQVHALLAGVSRPMICGFMAFLDATAADGRVMHDRGLPARALLNYTPQACDIVSIYAYAPELTTFSTVDWSMTQLMPDLKHMLASRGWNPSDPIIGTPQTFSWLPTRWLGPTADQLRTQTAAFCAQGAIALIPYAWADSYTGPNAELGNSPDLQRGFTAGLADCRAIWSHP